MDRRTVLRSAGVAACLIAGCATTPADGRAHHVTIRNWTTGSRTLGVIVEGDSGTLFDHRYQVDPASGREGHGFSGMATKITAILDGEEQFEYDYESIRCTGRRLVGVILTITDENEVDLSYECESIHDPKTTNGGASRI